MPRRIVPGRVYMVTRRCTQRQFLLRPDPATTNAFVYCLALAAHRTQMQVVAFLAHSNHHHTIVVDTQGRMPEFLEYFHKLVAKHQNALRGRWENFWASEASSVVELLGPEDILAKITYALTNPVKDHLIERAEQWPGASSLRANLDDRPLHVRRPARFFRKDGDLPEWVTLRCKRPPGFEHLTEAEWRTLLGDRIAAVESGAAKERQVDDRLVLGRAQVLRQRPTDRPQSHEPRREMSPRVAGMNKWARIEAIQRNKAFQAAYRAARDVASGPGRHLLSRHVLAQALRGRSLAGLRPRFGSLESKPVSVHEHQLRCGLSERLLKTENRDRPGYAPPRGARCATNL